MKYLFLTLLFLVLASCGGQSADNVVVEDDLPDNGSIVGVNINSDNTTDVVEQSNSNPSSQNQVEPIAAKVYYFDFDRSVLDEASKLALQEHAEYIIANNLQVVIEGHTDERGTREYNIALGERRGIAVRDFLLSEGVSSLSIEVISFGEEKLVNKANTAAAGAQNRRAILRYK